jgi:hypothetical protein
MRLMLRPASYWNIIIILEKDGAAEGTRTPDPIITNDVLYQLSYSGILLGVGPTMAPLTIQAPV